MAFVEKVQEGKNAYYHVTSSHRLPGGGWKKLRKYVGAVAPSNKEIQLAKQELEQQALTQGLVSSADSWIVVEEAPLGPPGRWRPLTIIGGTILRFSHEQFRGVSSFGQCVLDCKEGFVRWIIPENAVHRAAHSAFRQLLNDPEWGEDVNKNIENPSNGAFAYFKSFPRDFSNFSNAELADLFEEAIEIVGDCQEVGQAWLALDFAHTPPFVDYLIKYLEKQNPGKGASSIFSTLTTPIKKSNAQREELALVDLAAKIQEDERAFSLFTTAKTFDEKFFEKFKGESPRLHRLFANHVQEFNWLPFMYEGPAWDEAYFAQTVSMLLKNRPNIRGLQEELALNSAVLEEKQEGYFRQFKVDEKHARLLEMAREIVWGRGYRKDAIYHGFCKLLPLYEESCKRLGLSLPRLRYLFWWELPEMLRGEKKIHASELDERHKHFVVLAEDGVPSVYSGKQAGEFMNKMKIASEEAREDVRELRGLCASPGQGRGIVCMVNSADDLPKMKEGNVLVSHATDPSLVVAMKKASAIVTDLGGLASHAAVVARELGVPCVVGTKIGTKILKEGELVHVDATHSVVRRIMAGE